MKYKLNIRKLNNIYISIMISLYLSQNCIIYSVIQMCNNQIIFIYILYPII